MSNHAPVKATASKASPLRLPPGRVSPGHGNFPGLARVQRAIHQTSEGAIQRACPACDAKEAVGENPGIQPKLKVGPANDRFEQEADNMADKVMRMADPGVLKTQSTPGNDQVQAKGAPGGTVSPKIATSIKSLRGGGTPLPKSSKAFFEPRFGQDFSKVRLHTDAKAAGMADSIQAKAFTLGNDIAFAKGAYNPESASGKQLLAHELTHTVQQRGLNEDQPVTTRHNSPLSIQQLTDIPIIARLSAEDCSKDCAKKDGQDAATGKFSITIYADKEGSFPILFKTHKIGHSWLRLVDDQGQYWTYGFWPQETLNGSNILADVEGCVHHPDKSHEPTAFQKFELTDAQFSAAFTAAINACNNKPKYNLFGLQCTEFVKQILATAGQGSFGGFGLIWESPNALDSWLRTNSLVLGASVTAATSATGDVGAGSYGLDLTYRHQFYSLLGQKLRLYGLGRAEISGPVKSFSAGAGLELNPQKVWLPAPFIEGAGVLGDLSPIPEQSRFGAGVKGAAGLRFNIDELAVVGIEYNVVKNIISADPTLHRLMLTAGIRLF